MIDQLQAAHRVLDAFERAHSIQPVRHAGDYAWALALLAAYRRAWGDWPNSMCTCVERCTAQRDACLVCRRDFAKCEAR